MQSNRWTLQILVPMVLSSTIEMNGDSKGWTMIIVFKQIMVGVKSVKIDKVLWICLYRSVDAKDKAVTTV